MPAVTINTCQRMLVIFVSFLFYALYVVIIASLARRCYWLPIFYPRPLIGSKAAPAALLCYSASLLPSMLLPVSLDNIISDIVLCELFSIY